MSEPSSAVPILDQSSRELAEPAISSSDLYRPVASLWHLLVVLCAQGLLIYRGIFRAAQLSGDSLDRIAIYQRTMLTEWIMLAVVLGGVWLHGSSVLAVLGERWRSARRFGRDLVIAMSFLSGSIMIGGLAASVFGRGESLAARRILPHGGMESWYWVALSITAGICEEAIYRGYLQRQFIALTRNIPAGIVISAVVFGLAHGYQGVRQAVQIGILGAAAGMVAYWCKTVRPGMIAHALQDLLGGFAHH